MIMPRARTSFVYKNIPWDDRFCTVFTYCSKTDAILKKNLSNGKKSQLPLTIIIFLLILKQISILSINAHFQFLLLDLNIIIVPKGINNMQKRIFYNQLFRVLSDIREGH